MYKCEKCGGFEPDGLGELPDYENTCVCDANEIKSLKQQLKEKNAKIGRLEAKLKRCAEQKENDYEI